MGLTEASGSIQAPWHPPETQATSPQRQPMSAKWKPPEGLPPVVLLAAHLLFLVVFSFVFLLFFSSSSFFRVGVVRFWEMS